jgi:spermidine/putrescine transport system permease protein
VGPKVSVFVRCVGWFGMAALYAPLIASVAISFMPSWYAPHQDLDIWAAYRMLWADESLLMPTWRSVMVALFACLLSTFLGALAAIGLHKIRGKGQKIGESLILFPLIFPEIVFGITSLIWFLMLRISLGTVSIILAHVTFTISYVFITVQARLHSFDHSLEEAASDLGANPWQIFWRIKLPLLLPGIIGAAMMSFALSFDDFLITFFVAGVGSDTLPLKLYSMIKFGLSPAVYSLSALVLLGTFLIMLVSFRLMRKGLIEQHSVVK